MRQKEAEELEDLSAQLDSNNRELAAAVEANTPTDVPPTDEAPPGDCKPPHEWAIEKGFLKLNDDGSLHFKTHTPWEYFGARVARKWADPEIDPEFAISEAEFDEAIAFVLGITAG